MEYYAFLQRNTIKALYRMLKSRRISNSNQEMLNTYTQTYQKNVCQ